MERKGGRKSTTLTEQDIKEPMNGPVYTRSVSRIVYQMMIMTMIIIKTETTAILYITLWPNQIIIQ